MRNVFHANILSHLSLFTVNSPTNNTCGLLVIFCMSITALVAVNIFAVKIYTYFQKRIHFSAGKNINFEKKIINNFGVYEYRLRIILVLTVAWYRTCSNCGKVIPTCWIPCNNYVEQIQQYFVQQFWVEFWMECWFRLTSA